MDTEKEIIFNSKYTTKIIKIIDKKIKKQNKKIFIYFIILLLINIGIIMYIIINNKKGIKNILSNEKLLKLNDELSRMDKIIKKLRLNETIINEGINKTLDNKYDTNVINNNLYEEFSEIINEKYINEQNNFCNNQNNFYNKEFEDKIKITNVLFNGIKFEMFVYESNDVVSNTIKSSRHWEGEYTNNVLKALNYFESKKNIKKKDIYIIDVGANIGWYTFFLGKYGSQ